MKCPNCGTINPDDTSFCSVCNTSFETSPPVPLQPDQMVPAQPKTSGLAIASLVLGIISLILCSLGLFPAIIGLILGCVAIGIINSQPNQMKGKELAISGIIISIIGIFLGLIPLFITFMMPTLGKIRDQAWHVQCASQLSIIGKAIVMYSNDYNDQFPLTLEVLIETTDLDPKNLVCPSNKNPKGQRSYIYRGNDLTAASPGDMILVYDKYDNHNGEARNVLYADFHVEKIDVNDIFQAIDHDNELRRQLGLREKSLEPAISSETD